MSDHENQAVIGSTSPLGFKIREVRAAPTTEALEAAVDAPLGPLANFVGTWKGKGFNTIFRPSQPSSSGSDNVLELNVTTESIAFTAPLGAIPNRGEVQNDIFLNGVSYLQQVTDVTTPGQSTGIHFEPGLWINVPATTDPAVPTSSLMRMASIPHGTAILAQGTSTTTAGPPTIPRVDITPFLTADNSPIPFPSQTAATPSDFRIPQTLPVPGTKLSIDDWTAMLFDPNSILRNAILGQTITQSIEISIATAAAAPFVGGGTVDMSFLVGTTAPNANAVAMTATFWIETVNFALDIPPMKPQTTSTISPTTTVPSLPMPTFLVTTTLGTTQAQTIQVPYTQIQYSQTVFLVFNTLTWPHVSLSTLVPVDPIPVTIP
jgi:hypothetical protein